MSNMVDWVRVKSIGERIFLLGQSSTSLSTTGLGLKGNRIYLTMEGLMILYMFDMDAGTMTTSTYCPKNIPHWQGPFWVVPSCKIQVKNATALLESKDESTHKEVSWNNFPEELLQLIFSSLSLGDRTRFRLTCKKWMPITPLLIRNLLPGHSICGPKQIPWLMSFPYINKGVCRLYHPIFGDTYTMNLPELEGAVIRNAKYGWLLMSKGDNSLFFFNPLTKETIQLPDLVYEYSFAGISFSALPTSPDCIVFCIDRSRETYNWMISYRKSRENDTENTWSSYFIRNKQFEFMASDCNPVFYDGAFYCLSKDGRLGQLTPDVEDAWKILPVPSIFNYVKSEDFSKLVRSFIVEHDGEILSAFMEFRGKPMVYKLDQSKDNMKWVRTECLRDKVLFHSPAACMVSPSELKGTDNRIYLSKTREENNMSYSLSTGRYHCLKCQCCGGDCRSICELGNCTWIQFSST